MRGKKTTKFLVLGPRGTTFATKSDGNKFKTIRPKLGPNLSTKTNKITTYCLKST